jgi:signal transduction histidine kinase
MTEPDEQYHAGKVTEAGDTGATASLEGMEDPSDVEASYQARIDEVAELITRVRHEINNPLTGVLGQAQLLLREDLSERARKRVETIEQLAKRIRDIVAQLRQVQKTPN